MSPDDIEKALDLLERMAPLGSGERFAKLKAKLAHKSGIKDPGALAASIGRKKWGKKRMAKMAAAHRK